jgi:hypothetical protein
MELAPDAPGIHDNYLFTLLFHPGYDARALKRERAEWNRRNAAPLRGAIATHDNELTLVRRDITNFDAMQQSPPFQAVGERWIDRQPNHVRVVREAANRF